MKSLSVGGPLREKRDGSMPRVPASPALASRATILALSDGRMVAAYARGAHDGNLITFYRVKGFRDLVY